MLYAFISQDNAGTLSQRLEARPAHLARLQQLEQQGRLIIAGPHPAIDNEDPGEAGFTGSLVIAEFPDLTSAEHWASEDPYVSAGVYKHINVKPFKQVLPKPE
jgi:uncharacterized protein